MDVNILTIFPERFDEFLKSGLMGKASGSLVYFSVRNIRDYSNDKHRKVDDTPYGGGAGMIFMPQPLDDAIADLGAVTRPILLSPRGQTLTQKKAAELAVRPQLNLICGQYEGIDQRVIDKHNLEELSIGDYVLTGGEVAAMVVLEAVVRLLPGFMGNEKSLSEESFADGLLEYPQYTKPAIWQGREVPEVLLSGHHANICKWQKEQSEQLTRERRPDLWEKYNG